MEISDERLSELAGPVDFIEWTPTKLLHEANELARLEQERRKKHSEHWRNPETGQVECECCCSWALDTEKLVKELDSLRAQLEQMSRPGDG